MENISFESFKKVLGYEDKIQNVYDIGLNTGIKEKENLLKYLNK